MSTVEWALGGPSVEAATQATRGQFTVGALLRRSRKGGQASRDERAGPAAARAGVSSGSRARHPVT